jgi:hypothetical protein
VGKHCPGKDISDRSEPRLERLWRRVNQRDMRDLARWGERPPRVESCKAVPSRTTHFAANVDRAAVPGALRVIPEQIAERLVQARMERIGVAWPPVNRRLLKANPVDC